MSHKSILALTAIAALWLAASAPDAGLANGLGARIGNGFSGGNPINRFESGVRVGNNVPSNIGRGTVPLTASQQNLRSSVGNLLKVRCHTVPVGDPRANPPMLVCP
jgi:hypothetical protein